jgi:hypothetical protein
MKRYSFHYQGFTFWVSAINYPEAKLLEFGIKDEIDLFLGLTL